MSHHGLQRALVVALHDPGFVDAVHADPEETLAPFGLSERERAELLAIDRRAFSVDRLRPRRVLKAIVEELKGSMAIALAETRSFSFADGFFASPAFRAAIIDARPLVLALADYLAAAIAGGRLASPRLPGVLAIERARAECRRDVGRAPPPGLSLAPGLRLVATDSGAMAALAAAEQHLFELSLLPLVALCDDRPLLELPAEAGEPLFLALTADGLTSVDEPMFRLLCAVDRAAASAPVRREHLPGILASVGLRVADTGQLATELLADGTLIDL
jgi:hypothetical protein